MTINEKELRVSYHFLDVINQHEEMNPMLNKLLTEIKNLVGCSAAGICLFDEKNNIPYKAFDGFSQNLYESKNSLSEYLDKFMCVNVINGVTDPSLPFYTQGGSFYINGRNHFLSTISEYDKQQISNICKDFEYESVALIPIRGQNGIIGLIHLADNKENMAPLKKVELLEKTTIPLSFAIERILMEEELKNAFEEIKHLKDQLQADNINIYDKVYSEFGFDEIIGQSDAIKYVSRSSKWPPPIQPSSFLAKPAREKS